VFSVKLGFKLPLLISALKLLIIQVSQLNFDSKNQFNFTFVKFQKHQLISMRFLSWSLVLDIFNFIIN
jgi:hypothetical protein